MAEPKQFCTFYVNDILLGIEVLAVQEVLKHQELTEVPLAPPEIQGLINLRGQIITAINLRSRMNLPPLKNDKGSMNVVTRINKEVVSFLVDSVGDVLEVEDESFEPVPSTVDAATRELVTGVYKLEGKRLLMVLDVTKAAKVPAS
jgi:purine-binding chemotaxis protein CheW